MDALKKEFGGLRTGRASVNLLDPVMVEAYGQRMPLNQVGTVSAPEPRLLTVRSGTRASSRRRQGDPRRGPRPQPAAGRPADPHSDPELNAERRSELAKLAHKYAEGARIAVRNVRRDGMESLKKAEKDHKISQDEHRQKSDEVQKLTDRYVKQIDDTLATKEKEIKTSDADSPAACLARRLAGSPARRHHHGWQRPLGEGEGAAARGGPSARRRCRTAGDPRGG